MIFDNGNELLFEDCLPVYDVYFKISDVFGIPLRIKFPLPKNKYGNPKVLYYLPTLPRIHISIIFKLIYYSKGINI